MIQQEKWYRESSLSSDIQRAYESWKKSPKDSDLTMKVFRLLLRTTGNIPILKELLISGNFPELEEELGIYNSLNQFYQGKISKEEFAYEVSSLSWDEVQEVPLSFLPEVEFYLAYSIIALDNEDGMWDIPDTGYVAPGGGLTGRSPATHEGSPSAQDRHYLPVPEFFQLLKQQGFQEMLDDREMQGYLEYPGVEFLEHLGPDYASSDLYRYYPSLMSALGEVNYYYDNTPENTYDTEEVGEDPPENLGGIRWRVLVEMKPTTGVGRSSYLSLATEWAREVDAL